MLKATVLFLALVTAAALSPAEARYYGHGWRHHHHHYGWYRHGYRPAVSDYYHHSRQLVGTR